MQMMDTFQKGVTANASRLEGGVLGNQSHGHNVAIQLTNNGNYLNWAQVQIRSIDAWYANQAIAQGASTDANGLVMVHEIPAIPPMMTADMLVVMKALVADYQVTIDDIPKMDTTPPPPTAPPPGPTGAPQPTGGPQPNLNTAPLSTGTLPPGGLPNTDGLKNLTATPSPIGAPPTGGAPPGTSGGLPGGLTKGASITPPPGTSGGLPGGLTKGASITPPPGTPGSSLPKGTPSSFTATPPPMTSSRLAHPGTPLANFTTTPVPKPGTGVGASFTPLPLSPLTGLPRGNGLMPPTSSLAHLNGPANAFGDLAKLGNLGNLAKLGDLGNLSKLSGLPGVLGDAFNALKNQNGVPGLGGLPNTQLESSPLGMNGMGMPMMPGMGGSPAASGSGHERSDASGLLGGVKVPWGDSPVSHVTEVGSPTGTEAGGLGLAGAGMPMMPGMGGSPATRTGDERSDASGLLDASAEPWTDEHGSPVSEAGMPTGALAGGESLTWPGAEPVDAAAALASGAWPLPVSSAEESGDAPGRSEAGELTMVPSVAWSDEAAAAAAPSTATYSAEAALRTHAEAASALATDHGADAATGSEAVGGYDGERIPVLSHTMAPEDPSLWEDIGVGTGVLGLWAGGGRRRTDEAEGVGGRTVTVEKDAWLDEEYNVPEPVEQYVTTDGAESASPSGSGASWSLPVSQSARVAPPESQTADIEDTGLAMWQRPRAAPAAGGVQMQDPPMMRSGLPPTDGSWPPPPAPEPAEDEADDDEEPATIANLLVQKPDAWGARNIETREVDWDAIE
jgi:hypothetical protein